MKKLFLYILSILSVVILTGRLYSDSIKEINDRAEEYYKNKDFNKAISEWLSILEIEPNNEEVQKRIEAVYDEKQKKDISLQIAKIQLRLAKRSLDSNLKESNTKYDIAKENFVAAYRIDPKDPEMQILRDDLKEFNEVLVVENRKKRLSEAMQKRYLEVLPLARQKMKEKKYEEALGHWEELLSIVPMDITAQEGKRQAKLAIENRLKYERILALLAAGKEFFDQKKYTEAELDFRQVLNIDSKNKEALSYLDEINSILEEQRNAELIRLQAEQLYKSGIDNIKNKNFDQAEEDFNNVLALIENYKDAAARLKSIDRLRKEYLEQERVKKLQKIDKEFQAGLLALTDSRYKDAVVAFGIVLELDPPNELAQKYMRTAKEAQEQLEEEVVTEDSPNYNVVNALTVSGKKLYDKGEYTESRRRWETILSYFPKNKIATEYLLKCNIKINPGAYDNILRDYVKEGRDLLKDKQYRLAQRKFELVKSISDNYPGIDSLIAEAKAGLVVKRTIAANVSEAEIKQHMDRGIDYYRNGGEANLKKALEEFKWVASKDPENFIALTNINKIESQLRVGSDTQVVAEKKLTPQQEKLIRTHYYNGINYYFNKDFDKAITEWRKILLIDPDNEKAKNNISKCLALLKR